MFSLYWCDMTNKHDFEHVNEYKAIPQECTNCYAPLKNGEAGKCDRCRHDAGFYHSDIAYNPKTDEMDFRKVKIMCPICGREFAALLSKFTQIDRYYYLDSDCEIGAARFETFCQKCKSKITFRMECS